MRRRRRAKEVAGVSSPVIDALKGSQCGHFVHASELEDIENNPADLGGLVFDNFVYTITVSCVPSQDTSAVLDARFQPANVARFAHEQGTALIFLSKKGVLVGVGNPSDIPVLLPKLARFLTHLNGGVRVTVRGCEIQNIVCHTQIPDTRINLLALYTENKQDGTYDPEIFPGAVYQITVDGTNCATNIYESGNFVILGQRSPKRILRCSEVIKGYVEPYLYHASVPSKLDLDAILASRKDAARDSPLSISIPIGDDCRIRVFGCGKYRFLADTHATDAVEAALSPFYKKE